MSAPTVVARMPASVSSVSFVVLLAGALMLGCAPSRDLPDWFDQIQRLPLRFVTVQNQRLAYLDRGQGHPVVLLHGFGGSMWQWEYQQAELAAHCRLLTLDLLGSGFSDKPDIEYRPDQQVEWFRGFLDALQIERATLIGNSMGAGLAIAFALTYPDRVDRMVLISGLPPNIAGNLESPLMKRAIATRMPVWLIELGNRLFGSHATDKVLREIVYDPTLLTPAVLERSNRNRRQAGLIRPLMAIRDQLPAWENDYAPRLSSLAQPTLLVWGKEDRLFPPHVGQAMQALIPHARLHLIPEAGHIPQWEQPQLVNPLLVAFLGLSDLP